MDGKDRWLLSNVSVAVPTSINCTTLASYLLRVSHIYDLTGLAPIKFTAIGVYAVIFILAVTGNLGLIVGISSNKSLQTVRNFFVLNLAASDLLVVITSLPITAYTNLFKRWIFGHVMCYLVALMQSTTILISSFTLAAISIDRYILIVHHTRRPINKTIAVVMISLIWSLGIVVSLPSVVKYKLISGVSINVCGEYCQEDWGNNTRGLHIYSVTLVIIQFVIPLSCVAVCYLSIYMKLRQGTNFRLQRQGSVSNKPNKREKIVLKRQRKTNRILVLMVLAFIAAWFPRILHNFLIDYNLSEFHHRQPYLASIVTHSIAMTSAFWNPILYGFMNEAFRPVFLRMIPCVTVSLTTADSGNTRTEKTNLSGERSRLKRLTKIRSSVYEEVASDEHIDHNDAVV